MLWVMPSMASWMGWAKSYIVDAPLIALTVMLGVLDAVDGRVTQIHVGAGQVDLGAEGLFALLELACTHPAEEVEVLFRGAVAPRRGTGGLACVAAAVLAHLVAGQVIDVCLALEDELLGILVALVEVVAAVEDAAVGVGTQPVQVLDDAVDILLPSRAGLVSSRRRLNLPPYWFAMDQLI